LILLLKEEVWLSNLKSFVRIVKELEKDLMVQLTRNQQFVEIAQEVGIRLGEFLMMLMRSLMLLLLSKLLNEKTSPLLLPKSGTRSRIFNN